MPRWTNGASLAALTVLSLVAPPHAASGQPAENNTFEWHDFDLSGEADPSNPVEATPDVVESAPETGPEPADRKVEPALTKADIGWSVFY